MSILLYRPYYGVNINGDMAGEMGIVDNSNLVAPDLSLLYAVSFAREHSLDITLHDANALKILPEKTLEQLAEHSWSEIILKVTAPTIQLDIQLVRLLKKKYPKSKIVLYGHCACYIEEWLSQNISEVDAVISDIPSYLNKTYCNNNKICKLNDILIISYETLPYTRYINTMREPLGYLWSSRGCPMRCEYCPYKLFYSSYDERHIDLLIQDIKSIVNLGITNIQFRDPYFTFRRERTMEFCERIIEEKLLIKWFCETKISSLDNELVRQMRRAGCQTIAFGVESADKVYLSENKRELDNFETVRQMNNVIQNSGIQTLAFYILGFPTQTIDDTYQTFRLARDIGSTFAQFNFYTPYQLIKTMSINDLPTLFTQFENRFNIRINQHISIDDLQRLADFYQFSYIAESHSIRDALYTETVIKRNKLHSKNIFAKHQAFMEKSLKDIIQ